MVASVLPVLSGLLPPRVGASKRTTLAAGERWNKGVRFRLEANFEKMGEKYSDLVGRFHLAKEAVREKWASTKEEGGITHTISSKVDEVKEGVIKTINHGDPSYDHVYR